MYRMKPLADKFAARFDCRAAAVTITRKPVTFQ